MTAAVAAVGRSGARQLSVLGGLARFIMRAVRAASRLTRAGRWVMLRVLINQIRFTALQAIGLVAFLAAILAFLVISQSIRQLGRFGAVDNLGTIMVVAVIRELGPLLTALIVVSRSGTAIAAEMATNRVMGEVTALEAMGIDPYIYLVLPRMLGAIVSVATLMVVFDAVALLSGYVAATTNGMALSRYTAIVLRTLSAKDVWLTLAKGVFFGAAVALFCSYHGLAVKAGPTEIPQAVTRGVVATIVAIFVLSALFVAVAT
ncbi:MAG TPA: ABC transporter permease [Gemmatimonadales bacterium]|nr:ABC transporter permease [Gemmatimonadales bacterium]